jgi:hypothetical protein
MLRVGDLVGDGLGFGGDDGIAWLVALQLFAAPLRGVDFCLDGRGRGSRFGRAEAAVGNQR